MEVGEVMDGGSGQLGNQKVLEPMALSYTVL